MANPAIEVHRKSILDTVANLRLLIQYMLDARTADSKTLITTIKAAVDALNTDIQAAPDVSQVS